MKFKLQPRSAISHRAITAGLNHLTLAAPRRTIPASKPGIKPAKPRVAAKPGAATKARDTFVMPPLRELQSTYKAFDDHEDVYDAAYQAYTYLAHTLLSSREMRDTGTSSTDGSYSLFETWKRLKGSGNTAINNRHNETFNSMKVTTNFIETRIRMPRLEVPIGYSQDGMARDAQEAYAKIIKAYFPDFELPKQFVNQTEEGFDRPIPRPKGTDVTAAMSLEKFTTIKPKYEHLNEDWKAEDHFRLPKKFAENRFTGIVSFDMKLNVSQGRLRTTYDLQGATDTTLYRANPNVIYIPLEVDMVFRWPIRFAYYVTCCAKPADFVPFMFFQYLTWHRFSYGSKPTRGGGRSVKAPGRVNHLGNITEMMDQERKEGRAPKPRTNPDGFVILGAAEASKAGSVAWIPAGDNRVPEYLSVIKNSYNADEERIEIKGSGLKGVGLLTDWNNEKYSYMNQEGISTGSSNISGVSTLDLVGSIPLDAVTIKRYLTDPLDNRRTAVEFLATIMQKYAAGEWEGSPTNDYFAPEYVAGIPGLETLAMRSNITPLLMLSTLANSPYEVTFANLGGQKIAPHDDEKEGDVKYVAMLNAMCDTLRLCAQDMLRDFDKLGLSYQQKILTLRFLLVLITKYGSVEYDNIMKVAGESEAKNKLPNEAALMDPNTIKMPNLTGIKTSFGSKLTPHQVETLNGLNVKPENALLDISMGGGKSLMSIADALNLVHDKSIKRPLFIVPGTLVSNTINEIQKFSNGTVNPFAITLQTCRRMNIVLNPNDPSNKPNYDVLKKLILGAPPNTIFVVNYRFLVADREDIVYGNTQITRLYAAEFLRDIGFDGVFLDESHFAKNLGSLQTQGSAIVVSAAKIKRELSGTMVSNTLSDLVGQSALVNPAIFRTRGEFNAKYGLEVSGDNVIEWKPGAAAMINRDLKPYAMRITHKRQRWAFLLPKMHEQFHPVQFTDNQKKFYNDLLEEAFENIMKDQKLAQKLKAGDEGDAGAIEQGLAIHFQALEQFVYAPDSNAVFANLETTTEEDLVSPKVAKAVEILDRHFNGYTDGAGNKTEGSKHKVIIFSHRTKTSEHIMKHLPERYRKIAVRYTAGDNKALDSFKKIDKYRILVADEKSINTGQNLQIADRMIRLETLWSPGEQDQAIARIWRPDFKDLTGRPNIWMDWIFTDNSLEVTKIGRLVSKIVEKIKYDRQEDKAFVKDAFDFEGSAKSLGLSDGQMRAIRSTMPGTREKIPVHDMLQSLPIIKMNTKNMQEFNSASLLTDYFATYTLVNLWEDTEFERQKASGKQKLIQIPDSAYVQIEGSKKLTYVPRVPGVDPSEFDPQNRFGYQPISVLDMQAALSSEPEADEDSEKYVEVYAVQKGELVDCEFGFGTVTKINKDSIWVDVKGIGPVHVPKATAWVVTNPKAKADVLAQLKAAGRKGMPRLPGAILDGKQTVKITPDVKTSVPQPKTPKAPDRAAPALKDPQKAVEEKKAAERKIKVGTKPPEEKKYGIKKIQTGPDSEVDLYARMIDGFPALTCFAEDADSERLVDEYDFRRLDNHVLVKIIGPKAFDAVMAAMIKTYRVNPDVVALLNQYRPYLVQKRLATLNPKDFKDAQRFVAVEAHRMLKPDVLRPFPMVWSGKLYFAFLKDKTPALPKFLTRLRRAVPGIAIAEQEDLHVKLYPGPIRAINELKAIKKILTIPTYDDTLTMLRSFKGQVKK